jgi:hypothetical protein
VVGKFDGGRITSDAGAVLLREVEKHFGIIRQFSACFTDYRDADRVEHRVQDLVAQRVYGLALGYEDLNDHDDLRHDPLLATLVGKADPTGQDRFSRRDRGKPLAGKSTLNRLELTRDKVPEQERYKKIVADWGKIENLFVDLFLQMHTRSPRQIVLDLDDTDDPLHGRQEGRFFHGYHREYCYLPLYVFCGNHLLAARLRRSNIDSAKGSVQEIARIVEQIRSRWPRVRIVVRGDSGFCRDDLMSWCEANGVDYVLGLARNRRLEAKLDKTMQQARKRYEETEAAVRIFTEFRYRTLDSWNRSRRVVAKAEYLPKGPNPRFVVTSLSAEQVDARTLYEQKYAARGDMENRIKEQQLTLFADRTSTHWMRSNQLRLWLSSVAYTLLNAFRRFGLKGTSMARAQCETIRRKLLKIGAQVSMTVRRIVLSFASACPYQAIFRLAYQNLQRLRTTAAYTPLRC